jgi:hypothetical protein
VQNAPTGAKCTAAAQNAPLRRKMRRWVQKAPLVTWSLCTRKLRISSQFYCGARGEQLSAAFFRLFATYLM